MKVIDKTTNKLTLRFSPWFRWMFVTVFNICAIFCLLALLLGTWDTFDCHRNLSFPTQGQCTLTTHTWITKSQRSWQLEQIKGVTLESEGSRRNSKPRERIDLHTTTERVTIAHSNSRNQMIEAAQEMQQFLENPQRSRFKSQKDERLYVFFCVLICLAFSGLFSVLGEEVTLEISKSVQQLTLRRRNLLGTRTIAYPINQIVDVIVEKKRGGKFGLMGRIAIALKDGKTIVVHPYDRYSMAANSDKSAALICRFLDLQIGNDKNRI